MIASMRGVGGLSYAWLGKGLSLVTRLDDVMGLDNTILDYLADHLLRDLDEGRREEIRDYMHEVMTDRGALLQLTVESMDIFNAAASNRNDRRYLSYLTAAPRPSSRLFAKALKDPYFPVSYALFHAMQRMTGRPSAIYPFPALVPEARATAQALWGVEINGRDNDVVVPVLSQAWGQVCGLLRADHLDVCGHFRSPSGDKRHTDWLRCGADFSQASFDALWGDVAARLMGEEPQPASLPGFRSL